MNTNNGLDIKRVEKLPQWAQDLVSRQAKTIDRLRTEIALRDAPGRNPRTNAFVPCELGDYAVNHLWKPSPHKVVRFYLGRHNTVDVEQIEDGSRRLLNIQGADVILPRSGNTFMLGVRR